jgi:two-component system, OmpR family, KDP operon response regulator KdpE
MSSKLSSTLSPISPSTVLLIEDDSAIAQFVAASLSATGLRPVHANCAAQAQQALALVTPALVIADLGLPDADGVDMITQWRGGALPATVPILVLSARTQEREKIAALDAGADDYLTKPFGAGELLARVRALLRRASVSATPQPAPVLHIGPLTLNRSTHAVTLDGVALHLSPIEWRLLERLSRVPGQVLTHRQLLADVWGADQIDQLHYLRIYMGHLRAKIETDPAQPRYLLTELGVGYRLADE